MKDNKAYENSAEEIFNSFNTSSHIGSLIERKFLVLILTIITTFIPQRIYQEHLYSEILDYVSTPQPKTFRKTLHLLSLFISSLVYSSISSPKFIVSVISVLMLSYSIGFLIWGVLQQQVIVSTPIIILLLGGILGLRLQPEL